MIEVILNIFLLNALFTISSICDKKCKNKYWNFVLQGITFVVFIVLMAILFRARYGVNIGMVAITLNFFAIATIEYLRVRVNEEEIDT